MTTYRPCFVVPNYNHAHKFEQFVDAMREYQMPIVVVNDGSDQATSSLLTSLDEKFDDVFVLHADRNGGKGSAVKKGIRYAQELGFTHALQIDADGQHDLNDVPTFVASSKASPEAVICGYPIYDDSVPLRRFLPRYLTHALVWLETLSFNVKDSMCGFRLYPIATIVALFDQCRVGDRMDYDIEVLVRLYWKSIELIWYPTKVIYPEDGSSNFMMVYDNFLITKMHIRLLFGMLWRSPSLLFGRSGKHG